MYRKLKETEKEKAFYKAGAKLFGKLLRGFMAEEEKAYKKQVREAWEAEQEENRKREAIRVSRFSQSSGLGPGLFASCPRTQQLR